MTEQPRGWFQPVRRRVAPDRKPGIGDALLVSRKRQAKLVNEDDIWPRHWRRRAERHRVHRRRIDKVALAQRGRRRRRVAPGRAARPAAAGRRHDDPTPNGAVSTDHPCSLPGRLPPSQAQGPDPELQGPADPGRTALAVGGGLRGHPHQTGASLVPVPGSAGDRTRHAGSSRPKARPRLASIAYEVNERTENIGARRLSTVMGGCWTR